MILDILSLTDFADAGTQPFPVFSTVGGIALALRGARSLRLAYSVVIPPCDLRAILDCEAWEAQDEDYGRDRWADANREAYA